ncbi:hypothetical protein [Roseiflexus castenholzii]|uniref:hypothetical protein n=1 Tax=Roseiflexus castenholzii TaxID=120962 RepID=UPI003C7D2A22
MTVTWASGATTRDQRQPSGSQSQMGRLAEMTVTWAGGATTRDQRQPPGSQSNGSPGGDDRHLGERDDDEGSAAAFWQSIMGRLAAVTVIWATKVTIIYGNNT